MFPKEGKKTMIVYTETMSLSTVFYANIDQSPVSRAQSRIYFTIMVAHVVFSNP